MRRFNLGVNDMLRIGLTGGIGAGKSTVSATFSECGGIVVDGDVISREVVEPGTEGLAKLVDAFGAHILRPDGALDRPALAAIAFSDEDKRQTLNGIVHPLVAHRRSELIAAAAEDAVIVEDIPLLVESQMAPMFPLVVIVHADPEVRVSRLIEYRGFTEADARARIAAQATEEQRRQVADVWLDNAGTEGELVEKARELWYQRILPFAHNLTTRTPVRACRRTGPRRPDVAGPGAAHRRAAEHHLRAPCCPHRPHRVDRGGRYGRQGRHRHAGDGRVARGCRRARRGPAARRLSARRGDHLRRAEARCPQHRRAVRPPQRYTRCGTSSFHASGDPGRPTNIHIRVAGWPNQQFALLFVDWLAANPGVRADYLAVKRSAAQHDDVARYADAKEPWFLDAYRRAWAWADATGWRP